MPWETQNSTASVAPQSARPVSKIPPPPVEVVIRTMESDLKALSQSGGIARPQGEAMKLNDPAGHGSSHSALLWPAFIFLGILVLAAAIYFSFFY